ncbi:MAG: glycosidase [Bacteroidetes bacterium]|nr:glycosidase [Bacteroidota bacterium]
MRKTDNESLPDAGRVILRYFYPVGSDERAARLVDRIFALSEDKVEELLTNTLNLFSDRHRGIKKIFKKHYEATNAKIGNRGGLTENRKLLIGAYFTMEYSVASAALFNPSIMPHPDQRNLEAGDLRFIQSFRAVGEGHISSILFGEGVIKADGDIILENNNQFLSQGTISHISDSVYELNFDTQIALSSKVIFPIVDNERMGIEDARFVRFLHDSSNERGKSTYFAPYTAYNGIKIFPKLIETEDFVRFRVTLLKGKGAENKGMALFPEKINGQYVMISRQDNENIFIMYSDDIYRWDNPRIIHMPKEPWEYVQIGNNGSPIKTDYGWLLLTHGVGAVRRYCMGAILLDLDDPSQVIGILKSPFLWPDEDERNGYVPNVVYSCGAIVHNGNLIVPYAVSDTSSKIIILKLDELIQAMER